MGIFDDAIRQHLDLKRLQGADESELKQLEDEAFGLPARPGDPDFPETGEKEAATSVEPESMAAVAPPAPADEAAVQPTERPESKAEGDDMEALVEKEDAAPAPSDEAPPHGDALLADPEAKPEPPPAGEGPVEDEGAPSFSTTEREAIADQSTEFFDQAPAELELGELDLDLEEEVEEVGALEEQPLTEEQLVEEAAAEDEPAVEEPPIADEGEVAEPEPTAEPAEQAEPSATEAAPEGEPVEGEDVLEETPEFLRDNPDDDELWFEQGQPKDFDF